MHDTGRHHVNTAQAETVCLCGVLTALERHLPEERYHECRSRCRVLLQACIGAKRGEDDREAGALDEGSGAVALSLRGGRLEQVDRLRQGVLRDE